MNSADAHLYAPQSVPAPGETLKETLEDLDLPQADLARRTGLSTKHINQLIQGAASLSPEVAILLERTTGVPAGVWNRLEAAWRTYLASQKEDEDLAQKVGWLANFPLAELVRRQILPDRTRTVANLRRLLDWFGVATPELAEDVWHGYRAAFRRSTVLSPNEYATAVWLRQAEHHARERDTEPYDRVALVALLPQLRALTVEEQAVWVQVLPELCARVGVAVVFVPALPKTSVSGATRWLAPDKAMVVLSDRFKKDDQFWFTFFHELAHILLHGKRLTFMDDSEKLSSSKKHDDPSEDEANEMAANILIPPAFAAAYRKLCERPMPFSRIEAFAAKVGVPPGVIVGRLQHDGALPWSHGNDYKRTIVLT
jgi:HTH-type transcriptional regulator/antitoxin HigA